MSTASQGRAREYVVRDELVAQGWVFIMRAAASKGAADLLMASEEYGAALIQVGTPSKTLGPADRLRLVTAADLCRALPLLAIKAPRSKTRYWHVTHGTPSTWHEWKPND